MIWELSESLDDDFFKRRALHPDGPAPLDHHGFTFLSSPTALRPLLASGKDADGAFPLVP